MYDEVGIGRQQIDIAVGFSVEEREARIEGVKNKMIAVVMYLEWLLLRYERGLNVKKYIREAGFADILMSAQRRYDHDLAGNIGYGSVFQNQFPIAGSAVYEFPACVHMARNVER